jgi:PKD repeat protein
MAKPVADFRATPLTGEAPSAVTFTDLSTNTPTQWFRDLGDGHTTLEQNPVHTYYKKGAYTVTLIASNADGEDYETKVAYVNPVETTPGQTNQDHRDEGERGGRSFPPADVDVDPLSTDRNYKIDYGTDGTRDDHEDVLA